MAGIDSSIYFQQQGPDILGSLQRGLSMRDMLDKRAEDRSIKDAYKAGLVTGPDGKQTYNGDITAQKLMSVDPQKGIEFQQQNAALKAAQQKLQYEKVSKAADFFGKVANQVKDQAGYEAALAQAKQMGAETSMMPPQWGPDAKQKLDFYYGQALSVKDQMERNDKTFTQDIEKQKLGIDREKLALERKKAEGDAKNLPQNVYQAATFGKRVEDANKQINSLLQGGYDPTSLTQAAKNKFTPDSLQDEKPKLMEQAQRNFVNAVLRRESGSAIADSEFESARKQYFPQPGDTPAVLAEKERNREVVLAGLRTEGSKAWGKLERNINPSGSQVSAQQVAATAHPQVDQAVQWAKANPNDPRAQAIMQRVGR